MNKYFITPFRQRFSALWVSQDDLDKWLREWKFFFMLGFGRSGTAFMANFLNQAKGAYVVHEPVLEDFYAHARAHYSQNSAENYLLGFRLKEMYVRTSHISPPQIYGEVNGTLRCHVNAIAKIIPNAKLLPLGREGGVVVGPHIPRRTLTLKNPFSMSMHPIDGDPWKDRWADLDRFARLCWFWQEENRRLRTAIGTTVQFEKILKNYDYFADNVLQPLGLEISKKEWETEVATPRNTSSGFGMPKWDQWSPEQQKTFRDVCGEEMAKCGYEF
jgi:hypothetical protein